jgi:hypothetical protein
MTRAHAQKYSEFYELFKLVVKPYTPHPYNLEFCERKIRREFWELCLKEPIHLAEWPVRKDFPDPSVDVSVDLAAVLRYTQGEIRHTRSTVYVTYFKRYAHEQIAKALENLRFDFHPETGEVDHPLLHAHVFSDKKPISYPAQLTKNFTIDWDSLGKRLNAFRLPIPNMTLPSVLCCLVACHLGSDKLKALLDRTKKQRESFPPLDISADQFKLFSGNSFAGSQWFERP